ncbi:MAG TPA: alternative ribosome rescue aminoacyl-tRNA hydrolase ArfB [Candidatus Eisenbacteria bacterium]|nr:alternative ribosome rescue aminoacyl-tRNA hydrolase ArfB [Candidatus Eisenbacteria bacterium]
MPERPGGGGARVPEGEIHLRTSRSGGPGGQNVNKLETRVEVLWNLDESASFSATEKERIREALGGRVGRGGTIRVVSQRHRSQSRNREAAMERLREIVSEALKPRKKRRATGPTAASREARLEGKRRRSSLKRERSAERDHE